MRIVDLSRPFSLEDYATEHHSGTHLDAPAYALGGGKLVGDYELERFICDAALLDITHKKTGQPIDDEDLEAAEEAAGLALREGEAVILHTGTSGVSPVGESPYLSRNGAEYLEFKGVTLVGIDSGNLDNSDSSELEAHRTLLRKEILVLEGLANLRAIDMERFRLSCLPLKLSAATSPVRAVAIVE